MDKPVCGILALFLVVVLLGLTQLQFRGAEKRIIKLEKGAIVKINTMKKLVALLDNDEHDHEHDHETNQHKHGFITGRLTNEAH